MHTFSYIYVFVFNQWTSTPIRGLGLGNKTWWLGLGKGNELLDEWLDPLGSPIMSSGGIPGLSGWTPQYELWEAPERVVGPRLQVVGPSGMSSWTLRYEPWEALVRVVGPPSMSHWAPSKSPDYSQ